jgi:threonine/homoserine/homoserine lactone efflux protein
MSAASVLAFWLVALVLIAVPGPDWAFVVAAGLRARSVVPAVAGLAVGYTAVTAVVAAGVGALVASSPALLTGLTVAGGAFLIWQGATTFAHPSAPATDGEAIEGEATDGESTDGGRGAFVRGIGVSGLNPKGLLIFLALLPQFTDPQWSWPVAVQIALLGLTFTATCVAFYLGVGLFARALLRARPAAARAVGRLAGAAMVVVGGSLLVERLAG